VFFLVAGLCAKSFSRAVPRVIIAILVMLLIASSLIGPLSYRLGRFTYGELGKLAYAHFISGTGDPSHGILLNRRPSTFLYRYEIPCTWPGGFDICYWEKGLRPKLDPTAHLKVVAANISAVATQNPWILAVVAWFVFMTWFGSFSPGQLRDPSFFYVLIIPSAAGMAFYCLIHMEPRYIAAYVFLGFTAMVSGLRYPGGHAGKNRIMSVISWLLLCFFIATMAHSLMDQSTRDLYSLPGKQSYRDAFLDQKRLVALLQTKGLGKGEEVAIVGCPPTYWARMAGVRIVGEVYDKDEYLTSTKQERISAVKALKKSGIKALIGKDSRFKDFTSEGWEHVAGTTDYFVFFLEGVVEPR
jgi:hypothetical protein